MKKILKLSVVVIIVLGLVYVMYFLYQKSQPKQVVWQTAKVYTSTIVQKTVITGSINPRKEVEIKPQINGIIQKLFVKEGDYVQEGDLIARIAIIPEMVNLERAKSSLRKAKIRFKQSETVYTKQKELYDKKVIAEVDFLRFEVDFLNAKEDYQAAENNLRLVEKGVINSADKNSNTNVYSTASGTVLQLAVKKGNTVVQSNSFNAGTTIAIIANMKDMLFKGLVDESEVGKLSEGMDIDISIGALQDVKIKAKLEHISPKGKAAGGAIQFEIKASLLQLDSIYLRAGYSANADIILDKRDQVPALQESWLSFNRDSAFVEVETSPNVFEKKFVKLGLSDGINIELLEGVDTIAKIKTNQPVPQF